MSNNNLRATILIADDDEDIRLALELLLTSHGYRVIEAQNAKETIIQVQRQQPDLVLLDMNFSRDTTSGEEGLAILQQLKTLEIPVMLMTAWGSIELAVEGLKNGACDFFEKPWNKDKLLNGIKQQVGFAKVNQQNKGYRQLLSAPSSLTSPDQAWVCQSSSMQAIEQLVQQIAPTDANILILGENGTGKSLLASRIHQYSSRSGQPFISVNMAAIPENLFESELFGHQKGAFTDAKQNRVGRFQLAENGSLFLDEIGTLPLNLQPKLLRVLETGQFESLGSSNTQQANIRLISATNADLSILVKDGEFRQDLLYRLNTLIITMPALRERLTDIPQLARHFIEMFQKKYRKSGITISAEAIKKLNQHHWPGNIRELSHVLERAVLLTSSIEITEQVLFIDQISDEQGEVLLQPLEQAEEKLIAKAMQVTNGNVIEAAKLLDISRNALYRRLEKFNIQYVTE